MKVAVLKNMELKYESNPPFSPSKQYPEYPFSDLNSNNLVYDEIRNLFLLFGLDKKNSNKKNWNPLGELIKPGSDVIIKPSYVLHYNLDNSGVEQLITQGSILRSVLDYVYIALDGDGTITIAEAPLQIADFEILKTVSGIKDIINFFRENSNLKINLIDLRTEISYFDGDMLKREKNVGDPLGYTKIDLNENSELSGISEHYERFRVTNYDKKKMLENHNLTKHNYLISNSVLNSDLIINLPKLKTHTKAGFTCALKNMVGVNGSKDFLPHHRNGSISEGGDEYLNRSKRKKILTNLNEKKDIETNKLKFEFYKLLYYFLYSTKFIFPLKDDFFEGSWYGNDTIGRTVADINKIIFYADKKGILTSEIQRKQFILVDGIVSGEFEGPLKPKPKNCGLLIAGYNPLAVDVVCSNLIGFDYKKLPLIKHTLDSTRYKVFNGEIDDVNIVSNFNNDKLLKCYLNPTKGWKGHIELND